jgi:hypothetical protein
MGGKLIDEDFQDAILDAFRDAMRNQPFYDARFPDSDAIMLARLTTPQPGVF